MKRNLVFVVLLAAIQASRRFRWRQSEQNCGRLSKNQALAALELTLCADCRQRESLSLHGKLFAVSASKILRRTRAMFAAPRPGGDCAAGFSPPAQPVFTAN